MDRMEDEADGSAWGETGSAMHPTLPLAEKIISVDGTRYNFNVRLNAAYQKDGAPDKRVSFTILVGGPLDRMQIVDGSMVQRIKSWCDIRTTSRICVAGTEDKGTGSRQGDDTQV
jgi:hypothetical protein